MTTSKADSLRWEQRHCAVRIHLSCQSSGHLDSEGFFSYNHEPQIQCPLHQVKKKTDQVLYGALVD